MTSVSILKETPAYMIMDGGFLLDAPVEEAWPSVIDFPNWQGFSAIDRISGAVGEEGEVFRLVKDEEGFEFPPYYARTLKIQPRQRITWKTFPTDVPEGTGFVGIVEFRLTPADNERSNFTYHVIYEFNGPFASEAERLAFQQAQYDQFVTLWGSIRPKLEQLIASRKASVQ